MQNITTPKAVRTFSDNTQPPLPEWMRVERTTGEWALLNGTWFSSERPTATSDRELDLTQR